MESHYEILEVSVDANSDDINYAAKRLLNLYDDEQLAIYGLVNADDAEALRTRIRRARDILLNPEAREAYDESIGLPPQTSAPDGLMHRPQLGPRIHRETPVANGFDDEDAAPVPMRAPQTKSFSPRPYGDGLRRRPNETPVPAVAPTPTSRVVTSPTVTPVPPVASPVARAPTPSPEVPPPPPVAAATPAQPTAQLPKSSPVVPAPAPSPVAANPSPVVAEQPSPTVAKSEPVASPPAPMANPAPAAAAPPSPPAAVSVAATQHPPPVPASLGPSAHHEPQAEPPKIDADIDFTGSSLRQLRLARGLSLTQVAERTRIGTMHLDNIESDRYERLPATVYLRGILVSVSRELGLDPVKVSRGYLAHVEKKVRGP